MKIKKADLLYETESTRSTGELVQAHNDALDITTLRKQFMNLLFSGKKRKVANIEGSRLAKKSFLLKSRSLKRKAKCQNNFWNNKSCTDNLCNSQIYCRSLFLISYLKVLVTVSTQCRTGHFHNSHAKAKAMVESNANGQKWNTSTAVERIIVLSVRRPQTPSSGIK